MIEANNGIGYSHTVDNSLKRTNRRGPTSQSEIGCFASHRAAWSLFSGSGHSTCLILEDDVRFAPSISEVLKNLDKVPDWDFLHFGFTTNKISIVDTIKNCMIPELRTLCSGSGMWLTHAYAINQTAATVFEEGTRTQYGGLDWQLTGLQDKIRSYGFLNKGPIFQEPVKFTFPSQIKHTQ